MMDDKVFTDRLLSSEKMLYRIAATLLPCEADRLDVMQETALRAWQSRRSLREESYFTTWLTRILINECRSLYRRQKRLVLMDQPPDVPVPPDNDPELRLMLEDLPSRQREALCLFYLEGFSIRDMARILRIPEGTVKYRLHEARKALKVELTEKEARL